MPEDLHRFTTTPRSLTEESELQWGGENDWVEELDETVNIELENGAIRPRPPTTTLQWASQEDWDNAQSRSHVVTRAVGVQQADDIRLGYDSEYGPLTDGLLAYYPMDEVSGDTVMDASGNAHHADLSGATLGAQGVLGSNAYEYNGSSDYATAPAGVLDAIGSVTVAAWIRPANEGGDTWVGFIGSGYNDSSGEGFVLFRTNDKHPDWRIETTAGERADVNFTTYPPLEEWSLVVGTYNAATGESILYRNGTEENRATVSADPINVSGSHGSIGRDGRGNKYYNGRISDLLIWNRPLTSEEVQYLSDVASRGTLTTSRKSP